MNYFYARVSSKDQNEARQLEAAEQWSKKEGIQFNEIFIDKESGKNFDRTNYQLMKSKLREGDLIVVKSIDRFGRNYEMIIDEWSFLTKRMHVDIVVIDLSLLDTRSQNKNNLTAHLISDIVLQILSYVAQTERENIKARQAEGIRLAKERGVRFGAISKYGEELWALVKQEYETTDITVKDLAVKYGINRLTLYQKAQHNNWKRRNKKDGSIKKE